MTFKSRIGQVGTFGSRRLIGVLGTTNSNGVYVAHALPSDDPWRLDWSWWHISMAALTGYNNNAAYKFIYSSQCHLWGGSKCLGNLERNSIFDSSVIKSDVFKSTGERPGTTINGRSYQSKAVRPFLVTKQEYPTTSYRFWYRRIRMRIIREFGSYLWLYPLVLALTLALTGIPIMGRIPAVTGSKLGHQNGFSTFQKEEESFCNFQINTV